MTNRPKILPPVYLLLCLLIMVGLHFTFPIKTMLSAPFTYFGIPFILGGILTTVWAAGMFKKIGTPIKPFEPSTALVTKGLYRITRNPMYLGMVISLIGFAIFLGSLSPVYMIPLFAWFITAKFIRGEEKFLRGIFGEEYLAYQRKVRRWL